MTRLTLATLFLLHPSLRSHADVTGMAHEVDGDTIWNGGTKIRLHGIDAPETKQACLTPFVLVGEGGTYGVK